MHRSSLIKTISFLFFLNFFLIQVGCGPIHRYPKFVIPPGEFIPSQIVVTPDSQTAIVVANKIRNIPLPEIGPTARYELPNYKLQFFDIQKGEFISEIGFPEGLYDFEFSPDKTQFLAKQFYESSPRKYETSKQFYLRDTKTGNVVSTFEVAPSPVRIRDYGFFIDPIRVWAKDTDGTLYIWDLSGKLLEKKERISFFSLNGRVGYKPDTVVEKQVSYPAYRIIDISTGADLIPQQRISIDESVAPYFSPDGTKAVIIVRVNSGLGSSGVPEKRLEIWDLPTQTKQLIPWPAREELGPFPQKIERLAFLPDGQRFILDNENVIYLYDVQTGKRLAMLADERYGLAIDYPIQMSQDGTRMIGTPASTSSMMALVWDITQPEKYLHVISGETETPLFFFFTIPIALAPNGNWAVGYSCQEKDALTSNKIIDGPVLPCAIRIWDLP